MGNRPGTHPAAELIMRLDQDHRHATFGQSDRCSDPSNATGINGDQKNTSAADSGAVFIFSHSGNTWSQQAYVKAGTTTPGSVGK